MYTLIALLTITAYGIYVKFAKKMKTIYLNNDLDYDKQSIELGDNVRISRLNEKTLQPIERHFDELITLTDVMRLGQKTTKDGKCLGQIVEDRIEWLTYDEVIKQCKQISDALLSLGVKHKQPVGVYSANCSAYTLIEYGLYEQSMVLVPIYDTLGSQVASLISNETELNVMFCDTSDKIHKILDKSHDFKTLRHLVLIKPEVGGLLDKLKLQASQRGFQLHTFDELKRIGTDNPQKFSHHPQKDDLAIICYTSGTTSTPKGVMLSHTNVIASVASISIHLMDQHATCDDVMISILPLAHMFQRIGECSVFCEGGKVVYYSGIVANLATEIKLIRPSIMLAVPRIMNRIHDSIKAKMYRQSCFSFILNPFLAMAFDAKWNDLKKKRIRLNTIWDLILFNKVRDFFGGRLRLVCVGSAPLSPEVLKFLRCSLNCVISEGYGQTECVGPCTATIMGDYTPGHIGPPLVGCVVKLADYSEMGYKASEGRGEVLVKGPIVFKGYYKRPELTDETLDKDGWLHTGDIGEWTPEGTLRLLDRKKNIFKLAQGEYIAPEKIENILSTCSYIAQLFIHGEGLRSLLVGIVVPDYEHLKPELEKLNITHPDTLEDRNSDEILNSKDIKKIILQQIKTSGLAAGLKSFELPKNILVCSAPFTIDQGLLTPTLKAKRTAIVAHFQKQINALYKELESWGGPIV